MGPGIGRSLALQFGQKGFDIVMVARSAERLRAFEAELAEQGIRAQGFTADLSDPHAFSVFIQQLALEQPEVSVLHFNASAFHPALPSQMDLDTFIADFHTSVTGALSAVQAFLPILQAHSKAAIFLTGGGSALHPAPAIAGLSICKAGMRNFALALGAELNSAHLQVATVTVNGMVQEGTPCAPELIAARFWNIWENPSPSVEWTIP